MHTITVWLLFLTATQGAVGVPVKFESEQECARVGEAIRIGQTHAGNRVFTCIKATVIKD